MAKITKRAEILDTLHTLVTKEAEQAQTNISGEPCKDTKVTSVSESTETTDKNNVGPDKLNNEQGYEQKPQDDKSTPVASPKTAEEIDKVASSILATIQSKLAEQAQTNISGEPCKDTKVTSVSESTETTDKNNVGPDKLNNEQGYEQKPQDDKSTPVAAPKTAEVKDKEASYALGFAFCDALTKKAQEIKEAQTKVSEKELLKEAGRRDLDTIIAQAAAELEAQEKQAAHLEQEGARAFDTLFKQAQIEALVEENKKLADKVASYEKLEKEAADKQAALEKEAEQTKLAALVAEIIEKRLSTAAVK
jgi:hypothetical protein